MWYVIKVLKGCVYVAFVVGVVVSTMSCSSMASLQQEPFSNTIQQVQLGSVGYHKDAFLQRGFNPAAIPNYTKPIKLAVSNKTFNKSTYKAFSKANTQLDTYVHMQYVDSMPHKPKYVQLKIADKIEVIQAFNTPENKALKAYVKHDKYANVLTGISIAFNQEDVKAITKANAVFLIELSPKTYALQVDNLGTAPQVIPFNTGVVFAYTTSNCCWQENDKRQLTIVDLVDAYNACPNRTYRASNRAKKKLNLYKL